MAGFRRYISADLEARLIALSLEEGVNWWKQTVAHPHLRLAVRAGYLNAYVDGQSVFKIGAERGSGLDHDGRPLVELHYKYLLKPRLDQARQYVSFDGSEFRCDPAALVQTEYDPETTVDELILTATTHADAEKKSVAVIARINPNVIDLEIALVGKGSIHRIDFAALHPKGEDKARVVFYEVKRWTDARLRGGAPEVLSQIEGYRDCLKAADADAVEAYGAVCRILARLVAPHRPLHHLVMDVAKGRRALVIDKEPRLLIVGFDQDQKEAVEAVCSKLRERDPGIHAHAKGGARSFTSLPA